MIKYIVAIIFCLGFASLSFAGGGTSNESAPFISHTITSNNLTCTSTGNTEFFSYDIFSGPITTLIGNAPVLPAGCADKDVIGYAPTQTSSAVVLNDSSFSSPGGQIVNGDSGGSCPALGLVTGNTQIYQFIYDKGTNRWIESCPLSIPNSPAVFSTVGNGLVASGGQVSISPFISAMTAITLMNSGGL